MGREMRGGQHQVLLLLAALHKAGHQSTLLARKNSPLFLTAINAGVRTFPGSLKSVFKHSAAADIMHAHDARSHLLASLGARKPFVVSRRVAFPIKRSFLSQWKYGRAARYLAVSQHVANELRNAGVSPERIDVVFDAVDEASRGTYDPGAPAVGLSLADPQKGRDLLELAAKIAGVPVNFSENLAFDLQRASMLVYITRSEGLGSAALLAMSMGIPVIASRVGGLSEVFEDGVSGLYATNEPGQISATMRRLLESPGLAETLIANARVRIQECFSVQAMVEATLASYKRVWDA